MRDHAILEPKPGFKARLVQRPSLYLDPVAQAEWNRRNSGRFSMAPTAAVESGEATEENYPVEKQKFSQGADEHLVPEILTLRQELGPTPNGTYSIWHPGAGEGDDFGYMAFAHICVGLNIHVADHSQVALKNVRKLLRQFRRGSRQSAQVEAHLLDVQDILENRLNPKQDVMVNLSRVLHHLKKEKLDAVVYALGRYLGHPNPYLRATIIHPNRSDNAHWLKRWKSVEAPFDVQELLPQLSEAAGREVRQVRISKPFEVYKEIFTASTLMAVK